MAEEKKELAELIDGGTLVVLGSRLNPNRMPPILSGQSTKAMQRRVERFYFSVASIFEAWVNRRPSPHTQRATGRMSKPSLNFSSLNGRGSRRSYWPCPSTT